MMCTLIFCFGTSAVNENDISQFELPKPQTPNYFMYIDGNGTDGRADELIMIMVADRSVIELTSEWDRDSDAFYEKYGLYHFNAYMQYDVSLDGEDKGRIVYPPYTLEIPNISQGKHKIEFTLYGNRVNTFGPLHDSSGEKYVDPGVWYTRDYALSYEYEPKQMGIISSPVIEVLE